jgi:hypothetical protein
MDEVLPAPRVKAGQSMKRHRTLVRTLAQEQYPMQMGCLMTERHPLQQEHVAEAGCRLMKKYEEALQF